jgi:DNA-binding GntR family transcriptional regulator
LELTPLEALEIYSVREVLEGLAARLAAKNICRDAIARMEDSLIKQHDMVIRQDLIGYSRFDYAFHDVIHELSHNRFLQEMLDFIRGKTRSALMNFKPVMITSYRDHQAILEALKKCDGTLAERTIKAHIRRIIRLLKKSEKESHHD